MRSETELAIDFSFCVAELDARRLWGIVEQSTYASGMSSEAVKVGFLQVKRESKQPE